MKAVTWHGKHDVRVDQVPDPVLRQPTDAIIRVTSSGICGSDLHLYEVLGPFMSEDRTPTIRTIAVAVEAGDANPYAGLGHPIQLCTPPRSAIGPSR